METPCCPTPHGSGNTNSIRLPRCYDAYHEEGVGEEELQEEELR